MTSPSWLNKSALVISVLTALPLIGLLDLDLSRRQSSARIALPVEAYNLPSSQVLRAFSFGYNELAADLMWVRAIIYFSKHLDSDRDLRHLERHLNNIVALDKHFKAIYRFGSAMLMSRRSKTKNKDVLAAISLLKRGHEIFPDESKFPFHIAAYYISEMKTDSPRQRKIWRRLGADWIHRAALNNVDLPWLPSLAARIYSEQGERDLAIRHLQELYLTTQDEKMKTQIFFKLKQMKAEQLSDELKQASRAFEKRRQQNSMPYISDDLFILLGLAEEEPFSLLKLFEPQGKGGRGN